MTEKPLYAQVFDALLDRIASGALAPGAMLPSEMDLAKEFDVSQGTARKAVSLLERDRVVERQQGRGTFVAARTPESALFHFYRLRGADGAVETPALIEEVVTRRAAEPVEQATLIGAPREVFEIARTRSLFGAPASVERSMVPAQLFPGLAERAPLPNTLYVFYQHVYACAVVKADETLRACAADAAAARKLQVAEGAPLLEVERIAYDLRRRAVERRVCLYRTENTRYAVTLS